MNFDNPQNLPIPANTISELVGCYRDACEKIKAGMAALAAAQADLHRAFSREHYRFDFDHCLRHDDELSPEALLKMVKLDAWRCLVERMELKRFCSIKKAEEIDKQLETGEGLPDITEENVQSTLMGNMMAIPSMIEAAAKEVFEFLRPPRSQYKTNTEFEIGPRVILRYACTRGYGPTGFRIEYRRADQIRAMDNVFHSLDGKGYVKTHQGPLIDAVEASPDGHGETEYFEFRCHRNQNLHLRFKRMDLVAKLNAIAGGMRLKPATETP